ncbi:ribbon-helix-helix domain-containing protein [Sporosarcina pasteurii]|uniref:Predicted DNA-binding protein ribbon-helix-helix domain-containing protein n=1 Tax=Sporosarcina pasteurii TaxID=1474 RepID=A0A380BN96_SPOPA|nr:ribbon-helix-helix domain-containing protein [Sporosarcina pasteurii]MDS9470896.1 ribbon-helix-helix domain-containing protein [Sporosarcina pasteurii]QBQ05444.1 ribbon-helix-helix domain-containing protein [Sporosarcina pasteurii]SUJ03190.1 Uncharacterised protein [Sporosarcina pasteurii]
MKTAEEIINHLNATGANVYDLSEQLGFGRSTLQGRLKRLMYKVNQEGRWVYTGDPDEEPKDVDVVSKKRMTTAKTTQTVSGVLNVSRDLSIHEALMQLKLVDKGVRTTITIQPEYMEEMKMLATKTRLRLSDLYTLAIYELLEKYHSN